MMLEHCMHPPGWQVYGEPEKRVCCWCGMEQHREYTGHPRHGPYMTGETRDFHWTPASTSPCEKRMVAA